MQSQKASIGIGLILVFYSGHSSDLMAMRYLVALTAEDAPKIQQQVRFERVEEGAQ